MTQSTINQQTITEQQVFDFLATNPDYLERHPQLLSHLTIPHESGGVSLVERQVKILRDKNRELQGKLIEMLTAAQDNENLLSQCLQLTLCLLDCQNLAQLTHTLDDLMQREFHFDAVSVSLIGPWPKVNHARYHASADTLTRALQLDFPDNQPVCGRLDKKTTANLFAHAPLEKGSVAIMPLGKQARFGVLAVASSDETRFDPEMGTLFLELIAAVVTQMLIKFKDFDDSAR